jgi:hypothetical protein
MFPAVIKPGDPKHDHDYDNDPDNMPSKSFHFLFHGNIATLGTAAG